MLISVPLAVPADVLYSFTEGKGEEAGLDVVGWLADMGGLLISCIAAALCMYVAWGHLSGAGLSGLTMVRSFSLSRIGKVAGAVLLMELMSLVLLIAGVVGAGMAAAFMDFPILGVVWIVALLGGGILLSLFIFLRWLVFIPAVVVEDLGPYDALWRSWYLVKGHFWWVVGMGFLVPIFLVVVPYVMVFWIPGGWGSIIVGIVATPFTAIWGLLVYLELRARKDRLSVDALIEQLGGLS